MITTLLFLSLGGALGAVGRYWIGLAWAAKERALPYPTLLVNLVGSAILGGLFGVLQPSAEAVINDPLLLFAGVGFCGAFTTFSSFATETVGLLAKSWLRALLYVGLTVVGSVTLFWGTYLVFAP